jgi:putative FmdB family regulatory protein
MPIYAYRCASCGHAKDVLQKMSDPVLTDCPACGASTFEKQLTAAGFQLKGSGWYVTDFRGGNTAAPPKEGDKPAAGDKPADAAAKGSQGGQGNEGATSPAPAAAAPAAAAPAPAPAAPAPSPSSGS